MKRVNRYPPSASENMPISFTFCAGPCFIYNYGHVIVPVIIGLQYIVVKGQNAIQPIDKSVFTVSKVHQRQVSLPADPDWTSRASDP